MNLIASALGFRSALGRGRIFVVAVATVVFTTVAGSALAYWAALGTGSGTAGTGTLGAPTAVTARATAGSGDVSVAWTAPTGTPGAQGYYVRRAPVGGGTAAFACGTSASSPTTATSCTDTSVGDGGYTYTVTAVHAGWTATSAASDPVTVSNAVSTTTTIASSSGSSVTGQAVTFTATVTASSGSATPTGSVTFLRGTSVITCDDGNQTHQLNASGKASCTTTFQSAGSYSVSAGYAGSGSFSASSSSALTQSVGKAGTATALSASPNPSTTGQTVTYTATVSVNAPGSGKPTGSVTFSDSGTAITCAGGTQTLSSAGVATCQVAYGATGSHSVSASYGGDADYTGSTSQAVSQSVNPPPLTSTTTSLQSSRNPEKVGRQVTYTATVSATGGGKPTGSVTFKDGTSTIACAAGSQTLDASGTATCSVTYQAIGNHSVTAAYSGDSAYSASTSNTVTQKIINGNLAGIAFANVAVTPAKGTATAVTPSCTGSIGTSYTCTVSGQGNNASIAANVVLVDSAGNPVTYSSDETTVGTSAVSGGTTTPGSVAVPGGQSTSSSKASATKSGANTLTITFTLQDSGGTTYTAKLVLS